jgi:glycosyltransferase involved in cell wall biosynthesis
MCSLYRGAAALWFPSLYDGFMLRPLEAKTCGTPVALFNCSSLPEIAGDAALPLPPMSMQALVAAGRKRARMFTRQAAAANLSSELQFLL